MSTELLIDLVDKLAYIKELTLCGMKAVDDDTLEKVSVATLKITCWCFSKIMTGHLLIIITVNSEQTYLRLAYEVLIGRS